MRGNSYMSRKVGSKEPYSHKVMRRVVAKEVFIGNHKPTDHFAPAIAQFIPAEQLYDNRPRKK